MFYTEHPVTMAQQFRGGRADVPVQMLAFDEQQQSLRWLALLLLQLPVTSRLQKLLLCFFLR